MTGLAERFGGTTPFEVAEPADIPTSLPPPDGDKGDVVVSSGGTAWAIDSAYTTARDAYADAAAADAQANAKDYTDAYALPLHGTADTVTTNANLTGPITSVGNATTITDAAVTLAKMANLAQDQFIGRTTGSTGVPETATITAAARTVLDDTTVENMLTTLGGGARTGSGVLVGKTSPALTSPDIGAASGSSLAASSFVTCSGQTGIGYASGAGAAVVQGSGSGKATAVTLNNICGQITMDGAALAAAAEISFTVNCTRVLLQDVIVVCHQSVGTFGAYAVHAGSIVNGTSFKIFVGNMSAGSLSEAIVLNYVIIRGVKA